MRTKHLLVTSFSKNGWNEYARVGMESFCDLWPGPIVAYYENKIPENDFGSRVEWRHLYEIDGIYGFLQWASRNPVMQGHVPKGKTFVYDAYKFCRKSFANIDAAEHYIGPLWWFDADCEITQAIPGDLLDEQLRDVYMAYLGRQGTHIEAGILGFNTALGVNGKFMKLYKEYYTTGELLRLPEWHDARVIMEVMQKVQPNVRDMSLGATGLVDAIQHSPFRPYVIHRKGKKAL